MMIFMVVLTIVLVLLLTMLGRILNFFGKSSGPRGHSQVLKSKYSNASDKGDNGDKSHTFFRNCEKATTEPVTGDITGKRNFFKFHLKHIFISRDFYIDGQGDRLT